MEKKSCENSKIQKTYGASWRVIKGNTGKKKSFFDLDQNFGSGVFWGQELESEVWFLKFSSEVGEIGPPTAKTAIFRSDFTHFRWKF